MVGHEGVNLIAPGGEEEEEEEEGTLRWKVDRQYERVKEERIGGARRETEREVSPRWDAGSVC